MTQVDHQTRGHARLGGSAASIFTVCTGAPDLWGNRERKATAFTREGTAAHELAEAAIRTGSTGFVVGTHVVIEGEPVEITDEMATGVATYVDIVRALIEDADWHQIEQSFTLDPLWSSGAPEPMFGSADFVAVHGDLLTVLDLKFGKGVLVSAEANAQLLYYALGAYFALRDTDIKLSAEIVYVRVGICQPRMRDTVDWWTVPLIDLMIWGDSVLKRAVDRIHAGDTTLVAGKHCQFCVAKGACPALHAKAMDAAKGVFPPPKPELLSDDQLGEALHQAEILTAWMAGVRAEVETRIKNGKPVPGWKLVDKRGYRQWTDPNDVLQFFTKALVDPSPFMSDPELLSPAQVEKKLKARGMDPKALAPFIQAPVTGTTLVPDTDPRPAVATGPQNAFTPVV